MDKQNKLTQPELLFEVSWEVCNKVGGIHTVLTSKAKEVVRLFGEHYITIGPDIWRGDGQHPEFTEDPSMYLGWKKSLSTPDVHIRTGRWNTPGRPIAILIDFTPLFPKKNEILSKAWEDFRLDSLSGQWDYIEAALFGHAAGEIIRSFTEYYRHAPVLAHFHEWMTGMGVLYLKKAAPYIATSFTTHATVIGRSIAGNSIPLYEQLNVLNGDEMSGKLGVRAKHSLERIAANQAGSFSTVSEITAGECTQFLGRTPDVITPNGFDPELLPDHQNLDEIRGESRKSLIRLAHAVTGLDYPEDIRLVGTSGRYEFRNKGLDVFIDALGQINQAKQTRTRFIAFILVPANHYGARKSVGSRYAGGQDPTTGSPFLSHNLHDENDDPVIRRIIEAGLSNSQDDPVHVIFIPSYLDGRDGILNATYYKLLAGLDLTVFPSYYEPWGYTPLESLAYEVPTVTTDYAGFGVWLREQKLGDQGLAVQVISRSGRDDQQITRAIAERLKLFSASAEELVESGRKEAAEIALQASWSRFYKQYRQLYELALNQKGITGKSLWENLPEGSVPDPVRHRKTNDPSWKTIVVDSRLPEKLKGLNELARNLWWTWNPRAENLFSMISPELWSAYDHNPIKLLMRVPYDRLLGLEEDQAFADLYKEVYEEFTTYMQVKPDSGKAGISYFSMEYGFHASLKIYSGGLGILAGDYLKEASDQNYPLTGVGLLYRNGYFKQVLTVSGDQLAENVREEFSELPVSPVNDAEGNWITISLALPGRTVLARIWEVAVGRIRLYLMDTDFDHNQPHDRGITSNLYGGDEEHRLKQEMLLGVGGIRMLAALGLRPDVYHCNEGHAAFIGFERINRLMNIKQFTFNESVEIVRGSTLFTTHTPVPAGHDAFGEDLIRTYMGHYPGRMKISWDQFIDLGKMNPGDPHEKFSMSHLAANLSQEVNAVSLLHRDVTRNMFAPLWKGFYPEELHVGYVTNGIHYPTWTSELWQKLHDESFGAGFRQNLSDPDHWKKIYEVADARIWNIRNQERARLIAYLKKRLQQNSIRRHEPPRQTMEIVQTLNPEILTIGFARRFATYKRAHLLFKDPERLAGIVNHPDRPVQFLFAGKAHPRDKAGQDLIRYILEISRKPEFLGRIIFLENYDMTLGRHLVQGVDLWLNTPTRPLEASGTSGMKAAMNGVMNYSVLDGWWCEGYREGAGWALPQDRVYADQSYQDELDALTIYNQLEEEIIPLFYQRNSQGIPEAWVSHIRKTVAEVAPLFTTKRMMDDYTERFYSGLASRSSDMKAGNYHLARELSRWKKKISTHWDQVTLISLDFSQDPGQPVYQGSAYQATAVLDVDGLSPDDIGMDLVIVRDTGASLSEFVFAKAFTRVAVNGNLVTFKVKTIPTQPGVFRMGIRIRPAHPQLPHRQDFNYVKWL